MYQVQCMYTERSFYSPVHYSIYHCTPFLHSVRSLGYLVRLHSSLCKFEDRPCHFSRLLQSRHHLLQATLIDGPSTS